MLVKIFLSYRRNLAETASAGRLSDRLVARFGEENVFTDVHSIPPGADFVDAIADAVAACEVLLAVVGPQWLALEAKPGRRQLDRPDDWVRQEIEAGLARDVRVIPVLVDGAQMPGREELPATLAAFARRNAFSLRHETFRHDADRLIRFIESVLTGAAHSTDPLGPYDAGQATALAGRPLSPSARTASPVDVDIARPASGLADRFIRHMQGVFGGRLSETFAGVVHPVEMLNAIQAEADAHRTVLGEAGVLVPNRYLVQLSRSDHIALYAAMLAQELARFQAEFIAQQGWQTYGDVIVEIERDDGLGPGEFRIVAEIHADVAASETGASTHSSTDPMGRFERRLQTLFGARLSGMFDGSVHPVEMLNAMQAEARARRTFLGGGGVLVPNWYVVDLATAEHRNVTPHAAALARELAQSQAEFITEQGWGTYGDVVVDLRRDDSLAAGLFRITAEVFAG